MANVVTKAHARQESATVQRPSGERVAATTTHSQNAELTQSRAYEIFLQRINSGRAGDALSDWVQAEREVTKQITARRSQ